MKYYIISKENEMHLVPVTLQMDEIFRLINDQKIIVSADSIPDAFRKYDELSIAIDDPF